MTMTVFEVFEKRVRDFLKDRVDNKTKYLQSGSWKSEAEGKYYVGAIQEAKEIEEGVLLILKECFGR